MRNEPWIQNWKKRFVYIMSRYTKIVVKDFSHTFQFYSKDQEKNQIFEYRIQNFKNFHMILARKFKYFNPKIQFFFFQLNFLTRFFLASLIFIIFILKIFLMINFSKNLIFGRRYFSKAWKISQETCIAWKLHFCFFYDDKLGSHSFVVGYKLCQMTIICPKKNAKAN